MDKQTLREAQKHLSEARSFIEAVRDDEQEKYDEKTDTWKESDKGEETEGAIEALTEIISELERLDTELEETMK